jgi:hypothetical protein
VRLAADGAPVTAPATLFDDVYTLDISGTRGGVPNYAVIPDGSFLMVETEVHTDLARANIVVNWFAELDARLPSR